MKTRTILLLVATGIITLSFTFVSVKQAEKKEIKEVTAKSDVGSEPAGGFVSADKF